MTDHEVSVGMTRYGTAYMNNEDDEVELDFESEHDEFTGVFHCNCGLKFNKSDLAEDHLKEVDG